MTETSEMSVNKAEASSELVPSGGCACGGSGKSGGATPPSFVYALGRIRSRFPSPAIEKEYAQVVARTDSSGLTDAQTLHAVVSNPANRYLARRLCWIMTIEGLDTYLLAPRDPGDLDMLVQSLRREPGNDDTDLIIGVRGPIASPDLCNGAQLPIVGFDQIYSFDIDALIESIPRPESIPAERFGTDAKDLFLRIMQLADNAGATDEHRALNYLAVRYPAIYAVSAEAHGRNASLSGVDVRPSRLSGVRKIVDVVLSFTHRVTDVTEKFFVRVDVTEEFPFLVTKMSPFYDR